VKSLKLVEVMISGASQLQREDEEGNKSKKYLSKQSEKAKLQNKSGGDVVPAGIIDPIISSAGAKHAADLPAGGQPARLEYIVRV
jgi:hypothetical protein